MAVLRKLRRRLLLNAEPFGFGPTAAIADFFPHLQQYFDDIDYAGKGHTLDLQRPLPYRRIRDMGAHSPAEERKLWKKLLKGNYDAVLTAMDFEVAAIATAVGLKSFAYDAIAWYHRMMPAAAYICDMYIAQDFFGVRQRLASDGRFTRAPQVVAPIVPTTTPQWKQRDKILINLGGLNNPSWSEHGTRAYARLVVEAFCGKTLSPELRDRVVIAANTAIADELKEFGATNLSRQQMQDVLACSRYALMTPGLGNIYDAARFATPTIWLPPANDSQGQQLKLLQEHGMADGWVDWHDFMSPHFGIDYYDEQMIVLGAVALNVQAASRNRTFQDRLAVKLNDQCELLANKLIGNQTALMYEFGSGGSAQVASLVSKALTSIMKKK